MASDHDVIVTGAGISGMMAACFLARAGLRVLVLEANHQPGGLMAGVRRKGFYFDVGDQSFEDLGIVFPLLRELGVYDAADWERSRYQIRMPDVDVVVDSLDGVEQAFARAFPAETKGISNVFRQHRETSRLITRLVEANAIARAAEGKLGALADLLRIAGPRAPRLFGLFRQDFGDWYREQMAPGGLRELLSRCGYSRMNVLVASAFWHLWANDYWYPRGGLAELFRKLEVRLRALGGEVRYRQRVVRYVHERGLVRAVRTEKGDEFEARAVVHTGSLHNAIDLVGVEQFPERLVRRVRAAAMSDAMVSVYLGVDVPPEKLRETIRASHMFWFPSYDCGRPRPLDDPDWHRSQFVEISAHSLFQPGLAPEGKSALVLQAFSDLRWGGRWGLDGPDEGRKGRYRQAKKRVAQQLVELVEPILPGLTERIEWLDVGAPQSTVRFTGNPDGSTCGFSLHPRDFPRRPLLGGFTSPLQNLHLAGHTAIWPGAVPTAALSGKLVADRVVRATRSR